VKVVVFCCDLYADAAKAFLAFKTRNWPDCPYDTVVVTNSKPLDVDVPVHYVKGKGDVKFGWRLRKFIKEHYTDDLLLLMMVDYFIQKASQPLVSKAEELCHLPDVRHVRLRPMPHPPLPYSEDFGQIDKKRPYALSLQPGIWETEVIYNLCRDDEDPWRTELSGSKRTRNVEGLFLSVKRTPAIVHFNYYRKRKPWGLNLVRDGIPRKAWPEAVRRKYGRKGGDGDVSAG